ncbi:hypothetical protein BDN72DRAFT_832183 [Pluteus cervinus]|uniref:Uncharacterized protein n=1 Tax=Pluteus cervinus TaxID=181527 RepID=A0ACD3BAH3_9AGAR|nr:hypothetical protein BDN72DRAFT_832183 [Pluteus cervinus]
MSAKKTDRLDPGFNTGRFLVPVIAILAYYIYPYVVAYFTTDVYALCSEHGDYIYTVDPANPRTQCIVVQQGYIVDLGSLPSVKSRWPAWRPLVPALPVRFIQPGSAVIPGLSDSHGHILEYGAMKQLPLEGTTSIEETVARVREFILANPDILSNHSTPIIGGGWDHTVWPSTRWPSAADLDADPVVRGRHVVLQSKDCHALWVSTKALQASLPLPPTVDGGIIVRDHEGNPVGTLLDNAQDLLKGLPLTDQELNRRFKVAVDSALAHGITSIHDAGLDPVSLSFFQRKADNGTLPIRIYGMTFFNVTQDYWGNTAKLVIGENNGRFTARSVKIFADGALRTGGAALHDHYADNPTSHGFMRLDPQVLHEWIPKFLRDGWQVNVHAIGDRANGIVLDAFEAALSGANVTALRPRLEHAQLMTKADMKRLARLGVIASIQPTHAISDMWYAQDRLGPERVKGLYAFRSIIDNGARITLGTDFPVEVISPFSTFYAAVTRLSPQGTSPHGPGGWFPEERLTREEALQGMTLDPAYASFTESSLGSLEPGKRADYVVLSQDIMTIPADQILATKVLATAIDGVVVYGEI